MLAKSVAYGSIDFLRPRVWCAGAGSAIIPIHEVNNCFYIIVIGILIRIGLGLIGFAFARYRALLFVKWLLAFRDFEPDGAYCGSISIALVSNATAS
jgi:hypothetical protein